MYKSSILGHIARASRQHPFFSQNVNNANSTALSLVKPKLGLATERAYFSSWGSNGQAANNAGGSSTSQAALIAISNDDNQPWEKDLGLHRRQYRSFAGVRRYSTGTRCAAEIETDRVPLQLYGAGEAVSNNLAAVTNDDLGAEGVEHQEKPVRSLWQIEFDENLERLLLSGKTIEVCNRVNAAIESNDKLDTTSFNLLFEALAKLDETGLYYTAGGTLQETLFTTPVVLHYYSIMLEKQIRPDFRTFETLLTYLIRHRSDVEDQVLILGSNQCFQDLKQNVFLAMNRQRLLEAREADATAVALQIFRASISSSQPPYSPAVLQGLLDCCVAAGRVDDAVTIYDYIERTKTPKTVDMYSTLIETFVKAKDLAGAIEIFNTWKKNCRTIPRHDFFIIYDGLIRCYFAAGDVAGALSFFQSASQGRSRIDALHYINIARCFAERGLFKEATEFAEENLKHIPTALSDAIGEIVSSAFRQGNYSAARECYQHVKSISAFARKGRTAFNYLATLVMEGQLDEAQVFVQDCVRNKVELRLMHLSALISKYIAAGRLADAFETAQFVGDRRVVWSRNEMNRRKMELFYEIFITDITESQALDHKTAILCIGIINTLARPDDATVLLKFLENAKHELVMESLATDHETLRLLCHFVDDFAPHRLPFEESPIDASEASKRSATIVAWIADAVLQSDSLRPQAPAAIEYRESLINIAESLGLDAQVAALRDSLTTIKNTKQRSTLRLLPPLRTVFRQSSDDTIDGRVGHMLRKAFESADTRARRPGVEISRKSDESILSALRLRSNDDRPVVSGEVYLKAIDHFGRYSESESLETLIQMSGTLLPSMILSPDCLSAARAIVFDRAILAYNEFYDNTTAQQYHDRVLDSGFAPSASAYGSFIAKMDENVHRDGASKAVALFEEALKIGVRPTEFLFNTVIARLAKARRNDDALEYFFKMKAMGLSPNGVTYGTIINSCCRVGETEQAEALLVEMESLPRNQNRIAPYNTLMQHFVQTKKDRSKAFYYWEKLLARAIPPTGHTYRLLIEAHGHLEPVDSVAAESVIGMMQVNGVRVETIHVAALISMYGTILGDLGSARRQFDFWTQGRTSHLKPDSILYQSILESYVKAGDFDGTNKLLSKMDQQNVPLTAYIANLAIESYANQQDVGKARYFFDRLPSCGHGNPACGQVREPSTYESMIRAYNAASMPQKSLEILDLLKEQKYPDAVLTRVAALIPGV